MVFVNRQLGNGFLIRNADSTKDQEHYFGGARKHIKVVTKGVAYRRTVVLTTGSGINDVVVDTSGNLFAAGYKNVAGQGNNWVIYKSPDNGRTWFEVDHYNGAGNNDDRAWAIAVDRRTNWLYAVGQHHVGAPENINWCVRKSIDGGNSWSTSDNFNWSGSTDVAVAAVTEYERDTYGVTFSHVHVVGFCTSGSGDNRRVHFKRTTSDSGSSWDTANFITGTIYSEFTDIAMDYYNAAGGEDPYHVGFRTSSIAETGANNETQWFGRHNSAGSTYLFDGDTSAGNNKADRANGIRICSSGNMWVAGGITVSGTTNLRWTVMHRIGGAGNAWLIADNFTGSRPNSNGEAIGVIIDGEQHIPFTSSLPDGRFGRENQMRQTASFGIFVVGYTSGSQTNNEANWTVRKSPDHGTTWFTVDEYCPLGGVNLPRRGTAKDGVIYVAGQLQSQGVVVKYEDVGLDTFVLSGSNSVVKLELHSKFFDSSNNPISLTGGFVEEAFGLSTPAHSQPPSGSNLIPLVKPFTGSLETRSDVMVSFMVSASNVAFNQSQISVEFRDQVSPSWANYKRLKEFGVFEEEDNGWWKFSSYLFSGSSRPPLRFAMNTDNLHFRLSASGGNYIFKDFKIEYMQVLTDAGVKRYKEIDNQYMDDFSEYLRFNLPKVE